MATSTVTSAQGEYCFADVVHALTGHLPEPYNQLPGGRLYTFAALFAYTLTHPAQFLEYAHERLRTINVPASLHTRSGWVKLKSDVCHFFALWWLVLRGDERLLRGPMDISRGKFLDWNGTRPRRTAPGPIWSPPEVGYVRVRWYPDVEATRKWPDDLGVIICDVELGPKGDLDLTRAMRQFGMENCYVIDTNRGKPQLHRKPVERLSALAIQVLVGEREEGIDRHEVIGIVEQPTELMEEARELRYWLDDWKYYLLYTAWTLPTLSLLAQAYACSARYAYGVASAVSSAAWLCLLSIIAVLLFTLVDTIALLHGKLLLPILVTIVLPVLWVLIQFIVQQIRAALPWIRAMLEAALLNEEEIEELQRRGSSDRSESEPVE
ncbi:hypothetical protein L226DRAFT_524978 [Lentinus tigrinus ALCF2SS1-7]|uniref:Uncharacterized protein n=1 Tax=Lentinus tigrinus ALCF2SS1-6 TaxID=1328759 RepID=A0A5C2S1R7_9APHY|nr:hypothetical protein L227DRAFT_613770 [Lentinus tigrinus ALCF2SS1-6]RPD72141.1 hypothetical protein L226DRAFT_524978 [Lentinus tigrinus ALCF2SS1-7]